MRKILLAVIVFISGISYAFHVEGVGNRTFIDNDGDTLFVFEKDPEFKSNIGAIDWYRLPDTVHAIQTGTDYLYPEHGQGYAVKVNGKWEYFWVFEYEQLQWQVSDMQINQSCEQTQLTLGGTIPTIQYTSRNKTTRQCPRMARVSYTDAVWGEQQWTDSLAVMEVELTAELDLPASPVHTEYTIVDLLSEQLGMADSIVTDVLAPWAVRTHPQAVVTTRDSNKPNEVERPVDAETLLRRSAPLEVEFLANGLNAEFYEWNLYKGQQRLLVRNEAQHRYTFTEPGAYRMVVIAGNSHGCETDSVDFAISVSESMLTVPNTFTPNGDGANDEFRVVYRSIKEFHMWVYNRWGRLVFKSDNPDKGWDGTINNRPAAEGAYYYVIRALGTDAEQGYISSVKYRKEQKEGNTPPNSGPDVTYMGVYQLSGDINLLR